MDLGALHEKIRPIAEEITLKGGFEFVRSEIGGTKRSPVVRVFIDKVDGLTIEHCAEVSREIEARLDAGDLIPTKYVLEVSSPGLERELTKLADYQRFLGRLAKVKARHGAEGSKWHVGIIDRVDDGKIWLTLRNSDLIEIRFDMIEKANLKLDLDAELKKRV